MEPLEVRLVSPLGYSLGEATDGGCDHCALNNIGKVM
jgi:hypothetical protein